MAPSSFVIPKPPVGQPVLIQNRSSHTVLELIDLGNSKPPIAVLRPIDNTKNQLWIFDGRNQSRIQNVATQKYLALDGANDWTAKDQAQAQQFEVAQSKDSTISLSFNDNASNSKKFVKSDATGFALTTGINVPGLENQLFYLVDISATLGPVAPVSKRMLKTGQTYRIRSHDGRSLVTMQGDTEGLDVYADMQFSGDPYQIWLADRQPDGSYTFQCPSNGLYIGFGGTTAVSTKDKTGWLLQDAGGFAWFFNTELSVSLGSQDMEVNIGDPIGLVRTDFASSQIWFVERYNQVPGQGQLKPKRMSDGAYTIHGTANGLETFISVSKDDIAGYSLYPNNRGYGDKFDLKPVGKTSRLTLTYQPAAGGSPIYLGDAGGFLGVTRQGSEFVLLESSQKGSYYLALAKTPSGKSLQVVSCETITFNSAEVFPIQDLSPSDASQLWVFKL